MYKLLQNQNYRKLLSANVLSKLGDSIYYLALMSIVSTTSNPQLALNIIVMSEALPNLLSPLLGAVADGTQRKWQLSIGAGCVRAALYGIVGVLMLGQLAFTTVVLIAIINLFSDSIGKYNNGLSVPLTLKVVPQELYAQVGAAEGTLTQLSQIVATTLGITLLLLMNAANLAFLNALFFLSAALLIFWTYQHNKKHDPAMIAFSVKKDFHVLRHLTTTFKSIKNNTFVVSLIVMIALTNLALASTMPAMQALVLSKSQLQIYNFQTTIAIISLTISLSMMTGMALSAKLFVDQLKKQLSVIILMIAVFMLCFMVQNVYALLGAVSMLAFSVGTFTGKLFGIFVPHIAAEQVATFFGFLNMILMILTPLGILFGLTMGLLLNGIVYVCILGVFCLILVYYIPKI